MIFVVGLVLIVIGWVEQVYRVFVKKHRSFSTFFLGFYILGAGTLATGSFEQKDIAMGALNVVIALAAFIVLVNVIVKRKNPEVL